MANLLQREDLNSSDFSNDFSLAAGGVRIKTGTGSSVAAAIAAALPSGAETKVIGNGIANVTGTGTTADPYIVNVPAASGSETKLVGAGTAVISGTGVSGDPYIVNVPAASGTETKVIAGTNITVTGTGAVGDPYVVSAVGGATGLLVVTHDATMTGDGTSGSPLSVVVATDAVKGIVELATPAESAVGTSTTLAVTPAGLAAYVTANVTGAETKVTSGANTTVTGSGTAAAPYVIAVADATDAVKGAVELATTTEAAAGTNSTLAVTPAGLAAYVVANVNGSETKVTAGTNTTITGTGTTVTPYVVNVPNASNSVSGAVQLAIAAEYPSTANDSDAATPAYVQAAIAAVAPTGAETKVTAGTNVTVTGTGTTADPYVVNAAGGGGTVPTATDTVSGISPLAVAANYPALTNDTDSATPAYVEAAIQAIPDTNVTTVGLVNLVEMQELGDGDKVIHTVRVGTGAGGDSTNTVVGNNALGSTVPDQGAETGIWNTAVGGNALSSLTDGFTNVAVGYDALTSSTVGHNNTAVGFRALANNATGINNTAVGEIAASTLLGSENTVLGTSALQGPLNVNRNTALGYRALRFNLVTADQPSFNDSLAIGFESMFYTSLNIGNYVDASESVCVGSLSYSSLGGIAIGYSADSKTFGGNSIAIGKESDATADNAVTIGASSSSRTNSVAIGANAKAGEYSVSIGQRAGQNVTLTLAKGDIIIGSLTSAGAYAPVFNITSETNRIVMGHTAVTNAYIQVAWTVVSDERDKELMGGVPLGLSFVNKLSPIKYRYKQDRADAQGQGPVRYGFSAQNTLAAELQHAGQAVAVDAEDPEKLRLNDQALIAALVNAVNELTARIAVLEAAK